MNLLHCTIRTTLSLVCGWGGGGHAGVHVCLSVCAGKLEEVRDCDCEGGLTVRADVLEQDGLLWEQ